MGIYRVLAVLSVVALTSCGQSTQEIADNAPTTMSPWHSLTESEINEAATAASDAFGEGILFNRISLTEPDKNKALTWQAGDTATRGADIVYRLNKASYIARYDFDTASLSAPSEVISGQPMLVGEELFGALDAVNQLPEVVTALARRGITGSDGLCLPRTVGRFFSDLANPINDRLVRFDCFNIRGQSGLGLLPTTSAYARPVEGISVLFDVEQLKLIEITDSFADADADTPPNDFEVIEFHESALDTRPALKPITIEQREGRNFAIAGSQINWQDWQFHLRFDPRQGTILNNVGVIANDELRPVAYEIAMSEMFVPYQDPDAHWFYRAYFDMGEYGFGNMATELKGNDCPPTAVYQDVVLHTASGEAFTAENRVCIFELDPG